MQGLWKTKVVGWNHKGVKRKSCLRKHLLKDKARFVRKLAYFEVETKIVLGKDSKDIYDEIFTRPSIKFWKMSSSNKDMRIIVERRVRASVRDWITKGYWDIERKTSYGERSMIWLID